MSIELANLPGFRTIPGAVDFREDCIGRRGDDATLVKACRVVRYSPLPRRPQR